MAIVLASIARAEPFTTYADLEGLVAKWTHRSDLYDMLPSFLRLAEARISKDLRLASQLTTATLTQAAGIRGVSLPDDWLAFKSLTLPGSPDRPLEYVPMEGLDHAYGHPARGTYTIDGFTLLTGPVTTTPYTLTARYYARLPSLLITDNNWLVLNHPGIYLWSVLIEAMLYTQNTEQMAAYQQRYLAEVAQLQSAERLAAHSGSTLRIRTR
jgi:hypothetical protein